MTYFCNIHLKINLLSILSFPKWSLPLLLYTLFFCFLHVYLSPTLILLGLITITLLDEEYPF